MIIKHKIEYVDGEFDTDTGEIICVGKEKYGDVHLSFKANRYISFAKIKLYSKDLAVDAAAVYQDALNLGKEIERRWNSANADTERLDHLFDRAKRGGLGMYIPAGSDRDAIDASIKERVQSDD